MDYLKIRVPIPESVKHYFPEYETLKFGISYFKYGEWEKGKEYQGRVMVALVGPNRKKAGQPPVRQVRGVDLFSNSQAGFAEKARELAKDTPTLTELLSNAQPAQVQ